MVFNVMAVNNDDHTKNFAFLRTEETGWRLSPAYDVTHAYNPNSQWINRHLMAVNGKFEGITPEDLYVVGERNHVPGYRQIVRSVRDVVAEWREFRGRCRSRRRDHRRSSPPTSSASLLVRSDVRTRSRMSPLAAD